MDKFLNLTIKQQTIVKTKKRPITYSTTDSVKSIKSFFSTSQTIIFKPIVNVPVPNICKPFWWINSLSKIYSSFPLPINQQNYVSTTLNKLSSNNWFCVPSTYDSTFTSSNDVSSTIFQKVQEFLKPIEVPKKKVKKGRAKVKTEFKTHKIRLFPTKQQKEILNLWFKANRLIYNECIYYYKQNGKKEILDNIDFLTKRFIHGWFFNENAIDACKKMWVFEPNKIPFQIKISACDDFVKALEINIAKNIKFDMHYKSRKDKSNSILIQKENYKGLGLLFPTILCDKVEGEWKYLTPLVGSEPLPQKLDHDTRLQRTRRGLYYLLVLKPIESINIDLPKNNFSNIISLDPGVRTFMTAYDPDESKVFNWGQSDISKIYKLCYIQDQLQRKMDTLPQEIYHRSRKKFVIRKRWYKNFERIHNLVDQLHKNLCKWLVENYSTILLPKFETSKMVKKPGRNINSKTARSMMTWSHYRFQQRLISKAREYPHVNVLIVDEPYTSKTCGNCGSINHKLGRNKTFHCPLCHVTMDRDANGARNILLKFLSTDYHASQEDAAVLGLGF